MNPVQHRATESRADINDRIRLAALNETDAVALLDVVATSLDLAENANIYVSGNRSTVSMHCHSQFPDVWTVIADTVDRVRAERVVVRIVSVDHPSPPSRDWVRDDPRRLGSARNGLFGSLYELSDRGTVHPGGLIDDIKAIGDLRRLWGFRPVDVDAHGVLVQTGCSACDDNDTRRIDPGSMPVEIRCSRCRGPADAPTVTQDSMPVSIDGLRVLVDTGLFDVLWGGSRGCTVGMYDRPWLDVLVGVNTRDENATVSIPSTLPLPVTCPQRLPYEARDDMLYAISAAGVPLPRTPATLALTEVSYGYLWCMFDNTVGCVKCIIGLSVQSMYATLAEYYHFSAELDSLLETLAGGMAEYVRHCLVDHPGSVLCQVMDSFVLATQAVYLDVLHPRADMMRFDVDESRALRYRFINSGSRTITLFNLLEGAHNGIVTDREVDAVNLLVFSIHDAIDRRCDIRAIEASNLFNIVAAHNGVESAYVLGRFCTDVLAWAVNEQSLWPLLAAGRFLLWQIHSLRYRPTEILENLSRNSCSIQDVYGDKVLNSFNPLLADVDDEPMSDYTPADIFSVRQRSTNRSWYDQKIVECTDHFSTCDTCHQYDRASWSERTVKVMKAYAKKHSGNCECTDTMAQYSSLVLLDQVWWSASSDSIYTGPSGEWDPLLV